MNVTIDCTKIDSRESLHAVFAEALQFPAWYGNNLDALHDCLSAVTGTVRLENWEAAQAALGRYGLAAKRAIMDAAFQNQNLDLIL
nr:barstar family protein [Oscillospiraceae bacterium]